MNLYVNKKSFSSTMKNIVILGFPLLFGELSHYFLQIADSAMLGHFGKDSSELAAIGIAGLFAWMLNTFLWPLSSGVQAITARRFGRQDSRNKDHCYFTGEVLDNGILLTFFVALLTTAVSFLASPVLSLLIHSEEILELALQYIRIIRFSLIPTGLYFVVQSFFSAINKTRYVMYSGVLSNIVNVSLNWVFIFGKFGLPAMGIEGAALGTALSYIISTIFLFLVIIRSHYIKTYRLFHFDRIHKNIQKDILKVAIPPGIQNLIALAILMSYQAIIEDYSTVYLAATHSIFAYFRLNKTIISGFGSSAAILSGNALGRGDKAEAQRLITAAGFISGSVAILVSIITFFGRGTIAGIFTNSAETSAVIAQALLFFMPFYFFEALGYAFELVFVPNGYGKWVLFSEFTTNVLFILSATLLISHFYPGQIRLAWLCYGCYQVSHASLMILAYLRMKWLDTEVDSAHFVA
ncbi:MAG: hypothetical protein B6241_02305 [Spirochaetaceae bacterium 4572_59]|nr:MAG: hypothetical protein B6241_02305 [Spirochaetaceae bacterium 4572_59]